ncbi:MAG: type III pantothenate kinase [Clostridia bacterium]
MILTLDVGNTNIKLGLFTGDELVGSWKIGTDVRRTSDETIAIIKQLFRSNDIDEHKITGGIMSSVIPQLNYSLFHAIEYYFGFKLITVSAGIKTGLNIKYESPKELGSDRIVNCVAALKKYGAPFILVDFGTATTYNAVNSKKEFVGGCITAGIKTTLEALCSHTAQLPRVELVVTPNVIENTTRKAIQSGIIYGAIGQTKFLLEEIKKELNAKDAKIIFTGGLSQLVTDKFNLHDYVDRELSLEGLNILYKLNTPCEK